LLCDIFELFYQLLCYFDEQKLKNLKFIIDKHKNFYTFIKNYTLLTPKLRLFLRVLYQSTI